MANVTRRKIKPSVAWDEKGTCPTADGDEAHFNDDQTNKLLTLQCDELETKRAETDSSTVQPGLREAPLSLGMAQMRCQWFSDTLEAVDANVASPSSLDKTSAAALPKQIHKRLRWQWKKSSSTVHSVIDENPDSGYSSGHSRLPAAACTARPTVVPLCLPPGCIPSEVIAQVSAKPTQSSPKERSFVPLDTQYEVDPWISDICAEAWTLQNPAQPGMISAPPLPALTVVHDLEEDTSLENNLVTNTVLKMFLQNQRVVYRRNAICEELEMITGFVKINGAKFNLWHLREELQKTLKNCK